MYDRILIVVDDRAVSRTAVKEGISLARVTGAELLFFTVLPRYVIPVADVPPIALDSPVEFEREARARAERLLAGAQALATRVHVRNSALVGSGDDDAECIAEMASREQCDAIVVASEGRNAVMRLLTGSVVPGLITASPVPVLVCKPRQKLPARATAVVTPLTGRAARKATPMQ